jgi:aminoglycoside/choline kinase family phosphotransferase
LRLAGASFSENALEDDFEELTQRLEQADNRFFMFRDFQSRNIMVRNDEVWFIDYQGGRRGALQYDVASLLYDAIVEMPDEQRESLLTFYINELQGVCPIDKNRFRQDYYHFVLIRLLQAMGAFGLRGLYERKPHFIDSIVPGLRSISSLFESGRLGSAYPEIRRIVQDLLRRF